MAVKPQKPMPGIGRDPMWQVKDGISNAVFAKTNEHFQERCVKADTPATSRQASKYRRGYGKAYNV